ncbi:MAG: thiamine diphosphokinase [Christensenellales bacterium]|jgi:thiamine pyrophosphokinase
MYKAALILNGKSIKGPVIGDEVICADGGYNLALSYGIKPDYLIGDLDSVKDYDNNAELVKFSADKDKTDGELAVLFAANKGCKKLHIYGADGGRLDHVMSNIYLLHIGATVGVRITIHTESSTVYLANSAFELPVKKGDIISIVPFSEKVHINSTKGLKYEIVNKSLRKGSTLGISNIATDETILIDVAEGEAIIFKIDSGGEK